MKGCSCAERRKTFGEMGRAIVARDRATVIAKLRTVGRSIRRDLGALKTKRRPQ